MIDKLIELIKSRRDPCDIGACPFTVDDVRPCSLCETESLAEHLIANGVTIQRWIPVSERLPDANGVYLSVDDMGIYSFRVFDPSKRMWKAIWEDEKVTHWMPLPEPPKEGE